MKFEEVLASLFGAVGGPVSVAITSAEEPPALIANLAGCLAASSELSSDAEGSVFFHFEDGESGFAVSRYTFRGAQADADSLLVVRLAAVRLWIDLEPT